MIEVEPGDQTQDIHLDTLDPANFYSGQAKETNFDACPAVGRAGVETVTKIAANRVRRQRDSDLGHCAQDRRNETVAIGPRPDSVIAGPRVAIGRHDRVDARDEFLGVRAGDVREYHRLVPVPSAVRRPIVEANGLTPTNDVVTPPMGLVRALEDQPTMHREDAFPGAGSARE